MRILCLNPYLPPPLGGIEKEILAVGSELVASGHEVHVLTTTARFPAGENTAPDPLPAGLVAARRKGWLRSTLRGFAPARAPLIVPGLAAAAERLRPDLVLAFNIGWGPALRPVLRRLRPQVPILYRTFFHPPGGRLAAAKRRYLLGTVALADRAFVATRRERDELAATGLLDPDRLAVIPPGVALYPPDPERTRKLALAHDLPGRFVIAHVARLSRFKGTADLVAVLGEVRARTGRDVVLLLIGAEDPREPIAPLVAAAGMAAHVRLAGEIRDDRELRALLAAADLMALPSEYESFGIAYIEALAEGVACLGCDVGGVAEAVGGGGVLVARFADRAALAAALVDLVSDDDRRRALGAGGRRRVRSELTWRHAAERILALGEQARAGRRAG